MPIKPTPHSPHSPQSATQGANQVGGQATDALADTSSPQAPSMHSGQGVGDSLDGGAAQDITALSLQMATFGSASATDEIGDRVAHGLLAQVKSLSTIKGTGVEHWGQGNPALVERRQMLSQLLDQNLIGLDSVKGGWADNDKQALAFIERTDKDAIKGQGSHDAWQWLKDSIKDAKEGFHKSGGNSYAGNQKVAAQAAMALEEGKAKFYQANSQTFSTSVLGMLDDKELRAQTAVDILLQFREPEDVSTSKMKMFAGGAGIQAVFELRNQAAYVDSTSEDPVLQREYALMRSVALANPRNSGNAVLEARHLISNIRRMSWQMVYGPGAEAPGFDITPYSAIHHNFSTQSPKVIGAFVGETIFGGGSPETFATFVDAMNMSRDSHGTKAKATLAKLNETDPDATVAFNAFVKRSKKHKNSSLGDKIEGFLVSRCQGKLDSAAINDPNLSAAEKKHLRNGNITSVKGKYGEKLTLVAKLYRTVCNAMPNGKSLGEKMFSGAQKSWPAIARVIDHIENSGHNSATNATNATTGQTLAAITEARQALRNEFAKHPEGYKRMEIWELDQKLDLLSSSYLGKTVQELGDMSSDASKVQSLFAMKAALQGALASGLDHIKDLNDPFSNKGPSLKDAVANVDALIAKGGASIDAFREVMGQSYEAIVKTTENIRSYIDGRIPYVSAGDLIPNPAFMDDFIKEGPLHYARSIAQKALAVGLEQEISAKRIVNPEGVSVLNNLGRVVFKRVLLADNMADLDELGAGRNDFCIIKTMDEKKMAAVGGVMSNFPGGYCHAAVYARGAGMAALSNPDIGEAWEKFVENADGEPLYYDDSNNQIVMMPLKEAVSAGLCKANEAESLAPGSNRKVDYLKWDEAVEKWETIGSHELILHPDRPTHHIEIYTPAERIKGLGEKCVSFADAGALGIDGRGLGGEKNTVLAMMSIDPRLQDIIPPGSYITSTRCFQILDDCGILDSWQEVYDKDPDVGQINDSNFLESKFYTDKSYRNNVRTEMLALVKNKLSSGLIKGDKPTAVGQALLDELNANVSLAKCDNWILRSSFSAEDRPYKSGAGQYDSFPNCRSAVEKLEGVIGVIASAWEAPPIENNVIEEYNLMHIAPAITAMKCLNADYSGVMISRDTETGHRRSVSYQVVEGFGGGVEDGITEEGLISKTDNQVKRTLPEKTGSILADGIDHKLWQTAMDVEALFHEKVEPGKGFATDMEWVVDKDDDKLYLVQARTVRA